MWTRSPVGVESDGQRIQVRKIDESVIEFEPEEAMSLMADEVTGDEFATQISQILQRVNTKKRI